MGRARTQRDIAREQGQNNTHIGKFHRQGHKMGDEDKPKFVFRNYTPHAEELKDFVKEPPPIPDLEKELVELCLEQVKVDEASREGQLMVRPRKANWDLKRDVEKKLSKLDNRYQRAVLEMIQEKVAAQSDGASNINLSDAVNKGEREARMED